MVGDQASQLRQHMNARLGMKQSIKRVPTSSTAKVVAVGSGKGGVGKSNFCVNFALSLSKQGLRVLVMDTDVGFANVEVLLNVSPHHSLLDAIYGAPLTDVIEQSVYGLSFISGGNGLLDSTSLSESHFVTLVQGLKEISSSYDVILLDCGAGVNQVSRELVSCSDELLLVTTPEPTSMTDAYAFIKLLKQQAELPPTRLIVNRTTTLAQGTECAQRLRNVTKRFLEADIQTLGYILDDHTVSQAVMHQVPVVEYAPRSRAAHCYLQVANNFIGQEARIPRSGVAGFFDRLLRSRRGGQDGGHSA